MTDSCCCPPDAGNASCELPAQNLNRPLQMANACPQCGQKGKQVQGQTIKALLSISLRALREVDYWFCRTPTCPVVYFSSDGEQAFTAEQIRERVYQKEPGADEVPVCYCFQYTAGEVRSAPSKAQKAILENIQAGIQAGQCACDLRNPQGSCCLGNVRELIKLGDTMPSQAAG